MDGNATSNSTRSGNGAPGTTSTAQTAPSFGGRGGSAHKGMDDFKAFVGGLSWETTEEGIFMYFESIAGKGKVTGANVMRDRFTDQPRGFGFVVFSDEETLRKVCEQKDHIIDGKTVEVKWGQKKGEEGVSGPPPPAGAEAQSAQTKPANVSHSKKLFVGGLTPQTKEEDLATYFSQFGPISSSVIKYDADSSRSRGFGFVSFKETEGLEKALQAGRHHMVLGKRVEIKVYAQGSATGSTNTNAEPQTQTLTDEQIFERLASSTKRYSGRNFQDAYREYFSR